MAATETAACPVRQSLLAQYRRCCEHYHTTLSELLDTLGVEEALAKVRNLYSVSVDAREVLKKHEREHGCYGA
jgi:hypothetical protein